MENQRIALITGANKGIGFEAARQIAAQGFLVLIGARDDAKGREAAQKITANGGKAENIVIDVTSNASVAEAARSITEKYGRLDALVNNAGVNVEFSAGMPAPSATKVDDVKTTFETNVYGPIRVTQAFASLLRKTKGARIVNVSSTLGSLTSLSNPANPFYQLNTAAYNSSKTVLNAWTVAFAKEFLADGVAVNSICPGWVKTDMGGEGAPRSVEQGASIIVKLATMEQPPNGTFVDENGPIEW